MAVGNLLGPGSIVAKTRNFAEVIRRQIAQDANLAAAVQQEQLNAQIARLIYEARTEAGLTQKQLAEMIGTKQSSIARLEDADYQGRSLAMLMRISTALGRPLRVEFERPTKKRTASRASRAAG